MSDHDDLGMSELERELDFIGPFEYHAVLLRGRRVPHLTATPISGGKILLALDPAGLCIEIAVADAPWLVPFMADCIMVGMGYTGFPEIGMEPILRPVAPTMTEIISMEDPGDG